MERGYDLRAFHKDLILHFRNLLLAGSVDDLGDLLTLNPDEVAAVKQEAAKATPEELLRILHVLQEAESGLRYSSQPQIYLETLLVRLSHIGKIVPLTDLVREVERLKGSGPGAPGAAAAKASPSRVKRQSPPTPSRRPPAPRRRTRRLPPRARRAGGKAGFAAEREVGGDGPQGPGRPGVHGRLPRAGLHRGADLGNQGE